MATTAPAGPPPRFDRREVGRYARLAWSHRPTRWLLYGVGLALLAWFLLFVVIARGLPSAESLLTYQPPLPTNLRDASGEPVQTFARERRVELAYEEFPPRLIHAFISAEDKTFFSHGGIDYPGLVGAAVDYARNVGSGQRARGASTITQQVAKNLLLTNEYSFTRKAKEAILAYRIEDVLNKQQIMELYLNQIFLGRNAYGVQAAARAYFGKDVADLALHEMAYLAVLPKAPSNYSPDRFTNRAIERRNWVLGEMERNGFIIPAERSAAQATPLGTVQGQAEARNVGGYFVEEVRRQLIGKYGEKVETSPNSVYEGGLWVRTSLNQPMQAAAEKALRDGLRRYDGGRAWRDPGLSVDVDGDWRSELSRAPFGVGYPEWRAAAVLAKTGTSATVGFVDGTTGTLPRSAAVMPKRGTAKAAFDFLRPGSVIAVQRSGATYALRSIPEVSGAFVAQEVQTGRVLAMQGGWDARGQSFNRATQAMRQPGSTFKPFVYAAALDNGMTPASIIVDGTFCVYQSARLGQKCFTNFAGQAGAGPQTMRWGLEQSRNLMTVRTASQTGMPNIVATASRMGLGDYPSYLSIALGAGETTAMKITNAYAMLANHGRQLTPTLVDYVQDRNGKVIFRSDERCRAMTCNMAQWDGRGMPRPPQRRRQAMDPMTAYQVVHMLEGVVERGTATTLRSLGRPLFGKTGTTSGPTDVWFVGGTPQVVAGTYLGFDQPRPLGHYAQGGRIAAPIFKQFAQVAFKDLPVVPFRAAPGIRMVRIDRRSGRRVYGAFPTSADPKAAVIWEAFKPESEPRRSVQRYTGAQERLEQARRAAAAGGRVVAPPARERPEAPAGGGEPLAR